MFKKKQKKEEIKVDITRTAVHTGKFNKWNNKN